MYLFTNKLLAISLIIWLIVVLYSLFLLPHSPVELTSQTLEIYSMHMERMFTLKWIATITCGINISGLIAGSFELRKDFKISLIGLGGNFLMIILYLILVVFREHWVEEIYIG